MASKNVNKHKNHLEHTKLNTIHSKTTFESFHKLRNKIKDNARLVYSHQVGGAYNHLGIVLTQEQYSLISPIAFIWPPHHGPWTLTYHTTTAMSTKMRNTHVKYVRVFRKFLGVESVKIQQEISAAEETYLVDICNRSLNSIMVMISKLMTHLQENYGHTIPQNILKR